MNIDGIIPIIPTTFDEKDRIDWSAFERLLDFACGIDVCAVCLPAYASEFYKLSDAERREIIAKAVRAMRRPNARDRTGERRLRHPDA